MRGESERKKRKKKKKREAKKRMQIRDSIKRTDAMKPDYADQTTHR